MLKKILFLGYFITIFSSLQAQTTMSAGDMAIIGLNYDSSPYEMAVVNLVPLSSGTVVRITDYAYDEATSTFSTVSTGSASEGSIQWTLTSPLAAGTITKFTINPVSGTPVITGLPGTVSVIGWTNTSVTACPSAAGGDNWFIFQGPNATSVSTYVFAWCNPFALTHNTIPQVAGQFLVPGSGINNIFNSYLPPSLILGTNAISLSRDPASGGYHGDNNVYIGPKTGSKSSLITAISTISNWNTNEITPYDLNPGGSNYTGSNPIFTLVTPNNAPTDITLSATSINENVAPNSIIGNLSSIDVDAGNTFTYTLVAGTGDTDNASFNISGNNLRINVIPDFEVKNSYSIRIRTTDQGSLFFEKQFTITINNLCELSLATGSQTNIACNGGSNGSASVSPSGSVGGYTYSWAPTGGTAATATGLFAGTYTVTVTDSNGCQATRNFTITQPTAITGTSVVTNIACNGGTTGAINLTPSGGTPGYTFNWGGGITTEDRTGLSAGAYTVTITDANSCTATRNFTITQPTAIDNSVTLSSGILTATQTVATYQWYQCPNTILSGETNQTFTPTVVGDYKVEISLGGCTNTSSCVPVTILGNNSFDATNFAYYPNPTSDILHITNGNLIDEVEVSNMLGQQIIYTKFKSKEIQLSLTTLPAATYFIKVKSEGKSKTIKIIKQ